MNVIFTQFLQHNSKQTNKVDPTTAARVNNPQPSQPQTPGQEIQQTNEGLLSSSCGPERLAALGLFVLP